MTHLKRWRTESNNIRLQDSGYERPSGNHAEGQVISDAMPRSAMQSTAPSCMQQNSNPGTASKTCSSPLIHTGSKRAPSRSSKGAPSR